MIVSKVSVLFSRSMQEDIRQLRSLVEAMARDIQSLRETVRGLTMAQRDFQLGNSMQLGNGAQAMHMDREGLWFGTKTLAEITGTVPIPGSAILMDGTIYAKDGYTGTFTEMGGGSIDFVNGICVG